MSSKARREREKLALREAILTAAREIAASEGWSAVTIRKIADRVEYSPPTIYEYFDDKDCLLLALLVDGFRQLHESVRAARAANPDPEAALRAITTTFWRFAQDSPELYQVMNGLGGVSFNDFEHDEKPEELLAIIAEVQDALSTWARAEGITFANVDDVFHILWGTLHGLVTLGVIGGIQGDAGDVHHLLQEALGTYMIGWKNTPNL